MSRISIGDAELYHEQHGTGPPLQLVSGLGGLSAFWRAQVPALAPHFTVILHDHRGTGQSDKTRMTYSVGQMVSDVMKLMDALGIGRAHFLGHSTGGAMGQCLALDHPERLLSLALSATWAKADAFFLRSFAARKDVLQKLGHASYTKLSNLSLYPDYWIAANDARLSEMEAASIANPPATEIALSRIDAICAFDRSAELGRIALPTLVICAQDDRVTPPYFSRELAKAIPNAHLTELPRGGHFVPQTESESYNRTILEFLLKQRDRSEAT